MLTFEEFQNLTSKRGRLRDKSQHDLELLSPYKVQNAVILAAGLSSRFAPISYERPKGVLTVKGEVLIERQIKQLREVGISAIYVVVGYKCEEFFYLEDKFDVKIVINKEYAKRNNNSSLRVVADKLSNTYICSSDNYFDQNPFEPYVYNSYYAASYVAGKTDEWCIESDGNDLITGVHVGGHDSWIMLGHVYFDNVFSKKFVKILMEEYDNPGCAEKLWEQIYIDHIKELKMYVRKYNPSIMHEFDSVDDVVAFDKDFIANCKSPIFDNISKVLGCSIEDIHDFKPLTESLTNVSCVFSTLDGKYVYRHPGIGTSKIINRATEKQALEIAAHEGFDSTYIYEDAKEGWKISKYIENSRNLDPHNPKELKLAMDICRKIHSLSTTFDGEFDYYKEGLRYQKFLEEKGPIRISNFAEHKADVEALQKCLENEKTPLVPSHNDYFHLNFLLDSDENVNVIDWEYAGMSDWANDIATFCICCELSEEEIDSAVNYYFEGKAASEDIRHVKAMVGMGGWCWYLWAILKESDGDNVGEWLYIYYKYGIKYMHKALEMYNI